MDGTILWSLFSQKFAEKQSVVMIRITIPIQVLISESLFTTAIPINSEKWNNNPKWWHAFYQVFWSHKLFGHD